MALGQQLGRTPPRPISPQVAKCLSHIFHSGQLPSGFVTEATNATGTREELTLGEQSPSPAMATSFYGGVALPTG